MMLQKHCLNQKELARRWGISHRTLERWRHVGQGPTFLKLGGRVLYRREEIEAFEESQLQRAKVVSAAIDRAGPAEGRRLSAVPVTSSPANGRTPSRAMSLRSS
ncbi:helix-turn-helix domain-containing protein [Oceaniglobus ichthyenteri]|uniref:helix-turn-helix transcriptional regulator n=1 Tax=Oceaniglobus ichthyenteri TaxID=2136177 RepID=UPI0030B837DD